MAKILPFKKLDFSIETEKITQKTFQIAFWPIKTIIIITIISFGMYFLSGYGNLISFTNSSIFIYLLIAIIFASLWLIAILKTKLKCPNCQKGFFVFSRNLEVKPKACHHCSVIFVKKTHPIEDNYNYSIEFALLKKETERRTDLAIFYLSVGIICCFYLLQPLLSAIVGSTIAIFIIIPIAIVASSIYLVRQLATICPCCSTAINWTELKPTEISKHCPHCGAELVDEYNSNEKTCD